MLATLQELLSHMSISLTTQVLLIQDLSQPEKHILTILCFRANEKHEVYSSIERLSQDCSCSTKTVERALKKFRDEGYLIYTGKIAPNSRNIPIYCIDLNHGLSGGGSTLTTDSQSSNHGLSVLLTTPSQSIWIDNNIKDNKKDNGKDSFSQVQLQERKYYWDNPHIEVHPDHRYLFTEHELSILGIKKPP